MNPELFKSYNELTKKEKRCFLYKHFKEGLTPYDLRKYGLPNTSLVRIYRQFCKENNLNHDYSTLRKQIISKTIDGEEFNVIKIPGYEKYLVSKTGKIYSLRNNVLFCPRLDEDGYLNVGLKNTIDNKRHTVTIHRAVISTYGPSPPKDIDDLTVDHINGNRTDNDISNLRWLSRSENGSRVNKHTDTRGVISNRNLSDNEVIEICDLLSDGIDHKTIAKRFNVDTNVILNIRNKFTYKHITTKYNFEPTRKINITSDMYENFHNLYFSNTKSKDIKEKMNITQSHIYAHLINNIYDNETEADFSLDDIDTNCELDRFTSFK